MNKPKRDRGAGRIFPRGQIAWIQFYDGRGIQMRESTGIPIDSPGWEKKAEKTLRGKIGEVAAGIVRDDRSIRYEQLRDAYLDFYQVNKLRSLQFDKQGKAYTTAQRRLDDFFRGFRAADIGADHVRKFIKEQQAKGLSKGSINRSIAALKRMFSIAKGDERLRNIPAFPKKLEEDPAREGFLEREQYENLSRALPAYLRLPLAVGYFTAMREGEILAIEWTQVDLLENVITLSPTQTKTKKGRQVPIIPELRALLLEQRAARREECPLVCFRLDHKGHAVPIRSFRKAWYSACLKAGLGRFEPVVDSEGKPEFAASRGPRSKPKVKQRYVGQIFHDLRRSGVRSLIRAGISRDVAKKISGHKTDSIFSRYNITDSKDLADAGRKLAEFHQNSFGDNSGTNERGDDQSSNVVN
jgi:integrase